MITIAGDATSVLANARDLQRAEAAAAAGMLECAAAWAALHPAESAETAATTWHRGVDTELPLAGAGTPAVDRRCVAELAAAVHTSTEAGQRLIGHALELRHRLPRLWSLVLDGRVVAWQARRVAESTMALTLEAASFVDAQVAAVVGRIGPVQLDRLVAAAIGQFMPEEAERRQAQGQDTRCFTIEHHTDPDGVSGQSSVHGVLDLVDALDLDAAISDQARALAELGCTDSLGVRRSRAAGDLARRQPALDLTDVDRDPTDAPPDEPADPESDPTPRPTRRARPRQITLYLHLSDAAITGSAGIGRVGNTSSPVTAAQIRDWCGQPDSHIVVKPVIDLRDCVSVHAYEVPDRIRERIALRDLTCVFPWCARLAQPDSSRTIRDGTPMHTTDCDHVVPYARGGPTSTDNLAPLCRRHHRLKTHTGWRYAIQRPGHYLWTSPHGLQFARDHTGTHDTTDAVIPTEHPLSS